MANMIGTPEEFSQTLSDPRNKGRAYKVSRNVFDHYSEKLSINPITNEQAEELSKLLGTKIDASPRVGLTRPFKCQHCGHEFTFADHFQAAMDAGVHSKSELVEFTTPNLGYAYLMIDTVEPIQVRCVNCNQNVIGPRCCYTTSSYAYV